MGNCEACETVQRGPGGEIGVAPIETASKNPFQLTVDDLPKQCSEAVRQTYLKLG